MAHIEQAICDKEFSRIVATNNLWQDVALPAIPNDRVLQYVVNRLNGSQLTEQEFEFVHTMAQKRLTDIHSLPPDKHAAALAMTRFFMTENAYNHGVQNGNQT